MAPLTEEDQNHLRALEIGHYVYAGLLGLLAMIGPVLIVVALLVPWPEGGEDAPPPWFWVIYLSFIGSIFLFIYGSQAVVTVMAGRYVKQRRRWKFCMIVSGIVCTWVPIGTVLGVLSILVLARPAVQAAFRPVATPPPLPSST